MQKILSVLKSRALYRRTFKHDHPCNCKQLRVHGLSALGGTYIYLLTESLLAKVQEQVRIDKRLLGRKVPYIYVAAVSTDYAKRDQPIPPTQEVVAHYRVAPTTHRRCIKLYVRKTQLQAIRTQDSTAQLLVGLSL